MRGGAWTVALLAALLGLGRAAAAPTDDALPAAPAALSPVDAAARVEEVHGQLAELRAAGAPTADVAALEKRLPETLATLAGRATEDRRALERGIDLARLQAIDERWSDADRLLAGWDELLGRRASELHGLVARAEALDALWTATRQALEAGVPAGLQKRIAAAVQAIDATHAALVARRDTVLTLRNRVAQQRALAADVQTAVARERRRQLSGLRVRDEAPLWALWRQPPASPVAARVRAALTAEGSALRAFADADHPVFLPAIVLLAALLAACLGLARRARGWGSDDPSLARARLVIERPLSAAVVLWMVALQWLNAPMAARRLLVPLLALPLVRLLAPLLGAASVPAAAAMVGLLALDRLRDLLVAAPEVARPLMLLELALGIVVLQWLRRLLAAGHVATDAPSRRALDGATWLAQRAIAIGAVASVLGYTRLAELLGGGTLRSAWAAALLWVLKRVLDGIVVVLLRAQPLRSLNLVRRYQSLAARRARALLRAVLVVWWVVLSLRIFHLWDVATGALAHALGATLTVGEVTVSLGGVLVFVALVWGSYALSRGVRTVLDEEVFSRVDLPRGVPYALATFSGHCVMFLGFVLALGAAGIDFSRITIVLGALGVGVGLGLQGIVNDVVSGAILLFERPIRPGDLVQVGALLGEVRRIGLRASLVRSVDGADIIVPNSSLTGNQIINWTLADRRRRIDLPVGVAYGSDPQRVIAVLVEAARRQQPILEDPEPVALFLAFGDSALEFELRAWTDEIEDFFGVRSTLAVAVNEALAAAGLTVPFPQRDLHLRTLAPDVLANAIRSSRS